MASSLDLLDLQMIRALADTGSITAAAAKLGYSQPAVTQRLRRAERDVGQALVLRSGRGVVLTEAGRRLAQHAMHVQTALDAATHDLEELAGGVTGTLRLAGFPSASPTLIPRLLSSLAATHPRLTVTYVEAEPPEVAQLLHEGAIDLGLTFAFEESSGRGGGPSPAGLAETPLFRDTTVVVAPSGTFRDGDAEATADLTALADARFIGGCPRCRGHLLQACALAGFEPAIVFETDNALAVLALVAAGFGIALLPALSLVASLAPAGVETRPLPAQNDRLIRATHRDGAQRVPAVRVALAALAPLSPAEFGLAPPRPLVRR